jgi:hypothetical protein
MRRYLFVFYRLASIFSSSAQRESHYFDSLAKNVNAVDSLKSARGYYWLFTKKSMTAKQKELLQFEPKMDWNSNKCN